MMRWRRWSWSIRARRSRNGSVVAWSKVSLDKEGSSRRVVVIIASWRRPWPGTMVMIAFSGTVGTNVEKVTCTALEIL
jgi:hypothetical protein